MEGTYNIWRERNPTIRQGINIQILSQMRRRIDKQCSICEKQNILHKLIQETATPEKEKKQEQEWEWERECQCESEC